jgi:hypothetical protein
VNESREREQRTPVGDAVRELGDGSSLVGARKPPLVTLAIDLNVLHVLLGQLFERGQDGLVALAVLLVEGADTEVGVAACVDQSTERGGEIQEVAGDRTACMIVPAPFQSPCLGLGSRLTSTPNSSATLWRRNLLIHS